jgi:hypothetical protein
MLSQPHIRIVAAITVAALVCELVTPLAAIALTGGPAQPEFSTFTPVSSSGLVNEFSGAFTYSIPVLSVPGPAGSGYPLALSYQSGASMEEEASWVGHGWTLTPGAISRSTRGYPDDANGAPITRWNKVPDVKTITGTSSDHVEFASIDKLNAGYAWGLRFNNYKGFSKFASVSLDWRGVSIGGGLDEDAGASWSFNVNPAALLNSFDILKEKDYSQEPDTRGTWSNGLKNFANRSLASTGSYASSGLMSLLRTETRPMVVTPFVGASSTVSIGVTADPFFPAGPEHHISGSASRQSNIPLYGLHAYGFMYLANSGTTGVQDYSTEGASPYSRNTVNLPIPSNSEDAFIVMGEGLSGAFRGFHDRIGHVRPNAIESMTNLFSFDVSPHVAGRLGPGIKLGAGWHTLSIGAWDGYSSAYDYRSGRDSSGGERMFFRMMNDPGGTVDVTGVGDGAVRAGISGGGLPGFGTYNPVISSGQLAPVLNGGKRTGRSTYIGYHTNREMSLTSTVFQRNGSRISMPYMSETRSSAHRGFVDRSDSAMGFADQIGEFYAVNPSGMRYVYGIPVYSRNEYNLSYGLEDIKLNELDSLHLAFRHIDTRAETVIGEVRHAPYSSTYLLTEITTPDYRDLTYDGPTPDDLGGYTRFDYRCTAGAYRKTNLLSDAGWYRWRAPYRGLNYAPNSLSLPGDNMGSVASGDKEIYYMKSIETKTHVAVFVTNKSNFMLGTRTFAGSGAVRKDGFEALHNDYEAAGSRTATTAGGANKLEYLERIELFAKDSAGLPGKRIQTTYFRYNYSLCKNRPNSASDGDGGTVGKLTLEKVWSEFEGAVQSNVSPYVFGYSYRDSAFYSSTVQGGYNAITSFGNHFSAAQENPSYSPFNTDRWGTYQANGGLRHMGLNPWVDQTPDTAFDPAAWQLKWIRLPSGGEIQVHYEQSDYSFVQDRTPMAMVSLVDDNTEADDYPESRTFYLNVQDDLGIDTQSGLDSLRTVVGRMYTGPAPTEKIAFKLLYALSPLDDPGLDKCYSEYISGYAHVASVDTATKGGKRCLKITVGILSDPADVCSDFVRKNRTWDMGRGMVCEGGRFEPSNKLEAGAMEAVKWIASLLSFDLFLGFGESKLDFANSYMRIPMTRAKKGGGVRVKRILTYDPGLQEGDGGLYGSEYSYTEANGKSSGVATNEPPSGREENALVSIAEKSSDREEDAIAGDAIANFEGPIGESLLPGASVGYRRVVVRNIHHGLTAPGFAVREYFTAHDYPFDGPMRGSISGSTQGGRSIERTGIAQESDWGFIPGVIFNYSVHDLWRAQGYRFVLNAMHGQPRSITTFAGNPDDPTTWVMSTQQKYDYFEPGETVPLYQRINQTVPGNPGKEVEITCETRSVEDITVDASLEFDPDFALFFIPVPMPTLMPSCTYGQEKLKTHVTSKVIRYPAIVKRATSFADGVMKTVENVAFDPATGSPVVTKSADGFNTLTLAQSSNHVGTWYSYNHPASMVYGRTGQRARNERLYFISGNEYQIERRILSPDSLFLNIQGLVPGSLPRFGEYVGAGDLIRLSMISEGIERTVGLYHVQSVNGPRVWLLPVSFSYGSPGAADEVNLEVIASGYANLLMMAAASVITYGNPQSPDLCP